MINIILTILLFTFFFVLVFIGLLLLFNASVRILLKKQKVFNKKFYLKEIPITLNYKHIKNAYNLGQFFGLIILTFFITFTFLNNFPPLDLTVTYDMINNPTNITSPGPSSRVKDIIYKNQKVKKIVDDLVYFNTFMSVKYDNANVKIYFQNRNNLQTFLVGFQDQSQWHYNLKTYDVPILNNLNWNRIGNQTVLYQKKYKYNTVDDFLTNPPLYSIIGTLNYTNDIGSQDISIPNYKPNTQNTVINTPLRGRQTVYAYLDHEPFHMVIEKQDLNWYPGSDTFNINVYKDNDLVLQTTAQDDGIIDGSRKILPPTDITIDNPGPDLPETGVYKIVIDANSDTIIKSITTNLHKIVFANSIFPINNNNAYPGIVSSVSATTVYTNALSLSAITYHQVGEQNILVGNKLLNLYTLSNPISITPPDYLTKVVVPQNDVVLNAFQGYFAFSPDQFFKPSNYYIMPISTINDIGMVDYIITDYLPSKRENGWQINEHDFDLSTAYINKNRLNWVIEAPQLRKNRNSLIIKDIQITLYKKGWLSLL